MPLECEVVGCKARVAWLPLQQARHTLVLTLHGHHILGSPYTILVDESQACFSLSPSCQVFLLSFIFFLVVIKVTQRVSLKSANAAAQWSGILAPGELLRFVLSCRV